MLPPKQLPSFLRPPAFHSPFSTATVRHSAHFTTAQHITSSSTTLSLPAQTSQFPLARRASLLDQSPSPVLRTVLPSTSVGIWTESLHASPQRFRLSAVPVPFSGPKPSLHRPTQSSVLNCTPGSRVQHHHFCPTSPHTSTTPTPARFPSETPKRCR